MSGKLKCIVVDNDPFAIQHIRDTCRNSIYANIVESYTYPLEFLSVYPKLDFDLVFLDIAMPDANGFEVAKQLDNKPFIFVTGLEEKLKEAVNFGAIGVIAKPITKGTLNNILGIAYKLILGGQPLENVKDFMLFNVANSTKKVNVKLSEVSYVKTEHSGRQNKYVVLSTGMKYIFTNCDFDELIKVSASLIRINQSELISIETIENIDKNRITLKIISDDGRPKQVYLNRSFKKSFFTRLGL
jgi:two-component system LytT family response regulator